MSAAPRRAVRVRVPATSANLGPGFDALGLALDLVDEVEVAPDPSGAVTVEVGGEGAGTLPTGEEHLVVRAVRSAQRAAGVPAAGGLRLRARNAVPHGRGLGSSAAAVVAGLLAGRALAGAAGEGLDVLALATALEGHPDNAAAALLGGVTVAWADGGEVSAVRLEPHPDLRVVLAVPPGRLATAAARTLLPASVDHAAAAFTAGRAALLVEALTRRPDLLLPATADRLHQEQRRAAMPGSLALVDALRAAGHAAVVSGAGPTVAVLCVADAAGDAADAVRRLGGPTGPWAVTVSGVGAGASVVAVEG